MTTDTLTTEDTATTSPLAAACAAGKVRLYRQRSTGTTRLIQYLTGIARDEAEYYAYWVERGRSVADLAAEGLSSRASVRRKLAALALTEEIEAGDHDDLWEEGLAEVVFGGGDDADA